MNYPQFLNGQHPSMNSHRSQQTSRSYVPENNSSDEVDSYESSMEMDTEENSDQCGFETSSLSRESYHDDESSEEFDNDSSEERSTFLCKHAPMLSCRCRKSCGLYASENDSSGKSNSYCSDSSSSLINETCRCTQNSPIDKIQVNNTGAGCPGTSQFEQQEASSHVSRPDELSSDEFERKYLDSSDLSEYTGESSQYDQLERETDEEFQTSSDNYGEERQEIRQKCRKRCGLESKIKNRREYSESSDDFTFQD